MKKHLLFVLFLLLFAMNCLPADPGSGIAVDKYGQVFFTDTGQGVWKIDTQGKLTYLAAPAFHWMAIDEDGYFAGAGQSFGEWFGRLTPESSKSALIMSADFPLTVNQDGNIYYADTRPGSPAIVRMTPAGKESMLVGDKIFEFVTGITAAVDGSIYITEGSRADANTVRKITAEGKVSTVATISAKHISNLLPGIALSNCNGLAVDSTGMIYVAATGSRSILRISPKGQVSTLLQSPSTWMPTSVAVFQGEVYVLEWREAAPTVEEPRPSAIPRVRKIGRDGKVIVLATVSRK